MPSDSYPTLGTNTLPDNVTDQIQKLIETWTDDLFAGRIAEWKSFWAEEAVLMPAGRERVSGLGDITDYVTQAFSPDLRYRFTDWSFTGRDDLAVATNHVELNADGAASQTFNQMIVLRRDTDQRWRIQAVIFTPISG